MTSVVGAQVNHGLYDYDNHYQNNKKNASADKPWVAASIKIG